MKLLADENLAGQIVEQLRILGHDVIWAAELSPGMNDEDWLAIAVKQNRILITDDKDFGQIIFQRRQFSAGVILLRLYQLPLSSRLRWLESRWPKILSAANGAFVVVSQHQIRVRAPD